MKRSSGYRTDEKAFWIRNRWKGVLDTEQMKRSSGYEKLVSNYKYTQCNNPESNIDISRLKFFKILVSVSGWTPVKRPWRRQLLLSKSLPNHIHHSTLYKLCSWNNIGSQRMNVPKSAFISCVLRPAHRTSVILSSEGTRHCSVRFVSLLGVALNSQRQTPVLVQTSLRSIMMDAMFTFHSHL
jgi:hypothetical protein